MTWAVLCDFDHTITTEDVTDTLLEMHALPEWQEIEERWKDGEIGSRACMEQQIALLRATPNEVDAVCDNIHIDSNFQSFAALCAKKHIPLVIVSDGLDYVIKRVLKRYGIENMSVIAGHLEHSGGDRWSLSTPFANEGCNSEASTCKCAVSRQIRSVARADNMLYIGDGRSDFCVSLEEADMILAKDSLLAYCQKQALPHRPFSDFKQAAQLLEQIIQPKPIFEQEAMYA